ncbi:hypothetical protein ABPG75_003749 [Micractinium tetrahymenae]
MLDLQALVAASREAAMAGGEAGTKQLQLADVAGHAQHLLAAIEQRRRELRSGGAAASPAGHEPEDDPQLAAQQGELLLCFCIFRNTAAAGPGAAGALLSAGLLELAGSALDLLASAVIPLNWQLPAALAQALANLCTASGPAAAATWAALFPLRLSMLAHINAGPTQAATCLALLACCRAVENAAAALAGRQGSQLMTALLCNHQRMLQQGEHNDTLGLLAAHLCFERDLLPRLWASLGASLDDGAATAGKLQPTMAQAALLGLLCDEAQDTPQAQGRAQQGSSGRQGASTAFLVELAQSLAAASKATELSPGQQQVLQEALHLMRDICARDDSGRGLAGAGGSNGSIAEAPSPGADLVAELQAAGAVPALLAMLKALEPIQNPQQQQRAATTDSMAACGSSSGASGAMQLAELAPQLAAEAARFPSTPPYPGFRSDLLAALANAAHGRREVQAEVGRMGGVELVLAQCQLDRQSPLAREWALWAVRNLCEGNPEAQEAIRQLQLCTTVESEEMKRLGVKLELDEQTGKLRVTKRDPPGADSAAGAPAAGPSG